MQATEKCGGYASSDILGKQASLIGQRAKDAHSVPVEKHFGDSTIYELPHLFSLKNGTPKETAISLSKMSRYTATKRFGGNVHRGMSGKQLFLPEPEELAARIAQDYEFYLDSMTLRPRTLI